LFSPPSDCHQTFHGIFTGDPVELTEKTILFGQLKVSGSNDLFAALICSCYWDFVQNPLEDVKKAWFRICRSLICFVWADQGEKRAAKNMLLSNNELTGLGKAVQLDVLTTAELVKGVYTQMQTAKIAEIRPGCTGRHVTMEQLALEFKAMAFADGKNTLSSARVVRAFCAIHDHFVMNAAVFGFCRELMLRA
jgi:hypothetical protein